MSKFPLLLLDTGIIIKLHELGIWQRFTEECSVTLTSTVAYDEALYYEDKQRQHRRIDLQAGIDSGKIKCMDVSFDCVANFKKQFDPSYLERLDAGEAEALALVSVSEEKWVLSSADAIAFRVLGQFGRDHQGISLEEILQRIGLGRGAMEWQFSRKFRELYSSKGTQDSITGRGLIK